jgi:hypothetical protein
MLEVLARAICKIDFCHFTFPEKKKAARSGSTPVIDARTRPDRDWLFDRAI